MPKLKEASLDDVCLLVTDGTHDTPKRVNDGFPLIKAKEIVGGKIDFEACDQISEEEHLRVIARSKPEYGDTLFAHIGASLGEAAFIKTHRPFSIKNIALFKPNLSIIDERYLYYLVISPAFQRLAKQTKTGSAQPFLSLGHLRSHRITYNEALNEQRKIASILSTYDDLIENNLRRIKILEEMAQTLYREWFVKFRFPGHEKVRMVDSPLGKIPEGWAFLTLGEVTVNFDRLRKPLSKMQRAKKQGPFPYFGAARIFDYIDDYIFDGVYLLLAEDGSVVTADRRPVLQYVSGRFWANNHTHILKGKDKVSTEYLYLTLSDLDISGYITGAAQPKITQTNLNRIPVLVGPKTVMASFDEIISGLFKHRVVLQKSNKNLRQTRDLLLPRLISGELDVSELEIHIPEEVA